MLYTAITYNVPTRGTIEKAKPYARLVGVMFVLNT